MINVEDKIFPANKVMAAIGSTPELYSQWRFHHNLFPDDPRKLHSLVDACILISISNMIKARFGAVNAVPWSQKFLPPLFKGVLHNRLNFGFWSGTTTFVQKDDHPFTTTLDLDVLAEQVINGLEIKWPVFDMTPPPELGMKICERVDRYFKTQAWQRRLEVLKAEPAPKSLTELSVKAGVPLWILTAPNEPRAKKFCAQYPLARKLRPEPAAVTLQ
jgi:hypothetical protein